MIDLQKLREAAERARAAQVAYNPLGKKRFFVVPPATILSLLDRLERAEGALKPFADKMRSLDECNYNFGTWPDDDDFSGGFAEEISSLTIGDFRRAKKALEAIND